MAKKPTYEELEQKVAELEQDTGRRRRAEDELRKSEARYQTIFNNVRDIIYVISLDREIISLNPAVEEITGWPASEWIGKRATSLIHPKDLPFANAQLKKFILGEKITPTALRILTKSGEYRTIEYMPAPLMKDDELVGVFGIGRDITDRMHAEEALRESEGKFRSIMESMKDAVFICSPEHRIQYMNPAMINRIGRDAINEICHRVIYNSDEKCSWCTFEKIQQGEHVEYELNIPEDDKWYSISNSPIYNEDGSISQLAIVRDVTQFKKLENQLRQSQKMEAISALSGGIAHQFNNALSVVTGNIDLLELDFASDEIVADYAKKLKDPVRRMTQLTDQLLAYARGGKYQAKTVSLCDVVRDTLPLVKHTINPAIHVETDLPADIHNIAADVTQMQMVLSAVLTNASEAMDGNGSILVTCRNTFITDGTIGNFPGLKPGNYVNLTITDDGRGIDEETRKRIFEPFFTTKFQGRGLGMAASYGIVKNHNGWISVDSEPGQGTIVKIYLPATQDQVEEPEKPQTERIKGTGTILVIEDEETVMAVTRAMLEGLGYSVLEAKTGHEAIGVVNTFDGDIDLAMLDILLPDMSGNTIYPFLMEARPDLKVIVFSGYAIDGPAEEIIAAGAQDFLQKPFTLAGLSEKLRKVFDGE